ncbi:MAG: DHA2 family efflux MFS transporter permease subunit [Rhodospirillaceae bacterium]
MTAGSATADGVPAPRAGQTLERVILLFTLTFITLLYTMAVMIVNVALPDIRGALSATQDQVAWVVTANIIASAVATPIAGWVGGRFGTRQVMLTGAVIFTVSSVLCGTAESLEALVFYRIIQGLSGAPLLPMSQAILMARFPKHLLGAGLAIWGMGSVLGPIIAPSVGGYLNELYGWRWVFFLIVPFGLAAIVAIWLVIKDRQSDSAIRFDWFGFIALSLVIAGIQLILDRGERADWFNSAEIVVETGIVLAAVYYFLVHTFTTDRPFIRPVIFTDRNYTVGMLIIFIFGMLNFVPMVLFPPLLQELRGFPQGVIGMLLAARGAGTMTGFLIMAFAGKVNPRIPVLLGFGLQAFSGFVIANFSIDLTSWDVAWTSYVQGLGVGLIWVPLNVLAFSTLSPSYVPDATAILHLIRNMGSSIYISVSVTVVLRSAKVAYAGLAEGISPYNKILDIPYLTGAWSFGSAQSLGAFSREMTRQSLMNGYLSAFFLFSITAIAAMPLVALIRMPKAKPG